MTANYNNAAWFYDRLSNLVFGGQLLQAQIFLLDSIPDGSHILIAGGGTGTILDALKHKTGLTIIYAEISEKMVALSRKRDIGNNKIVFITGPAEAVQPGKAFDVIFTPFLLDNFSNSYLNHFIQRVNQQLKPGGLWLCADFQLNGRWWQPVLLKSMYYFFSVLRCVQVTCLPDIAGAFRHLQYERIAIKHFYGDFIKATVYRKPVNT